MSADPLILTKSGRFILLTHLKKAHGVKAPKHIGALELAPLLWLHGHSEKETEITCRPST